MHVTGNPRSYFAINEKGNVVVHPNKKPEEAIDLKDLVDQLQERGIQLPILLRFTDILRHRVGEIYEAFTNARQGIQLRGDLLLRLSDQGEPAAARRRGEISTSASNITSDSKPAQSPRLLAVLAMTNGGDTPIICNGFKDDEFIKMTILARKLGRSTLSRW